MEITLSYELQKLRIVCNKKKIIIHKNKNKKSIEKRNIRLVSIQWKTQMEYNGHCNQQISYTGILY